jgi:hypothetical protein
VGLVGALWFEAIRGELYVVVASVALIEQMFG